MCANLSAYARGSFIFEIRGGRRCQRGFSQSTFQTDMAIDYNTGPYDPCPCGSGAKYKFCCLKKSKGKAHGQYPVGTIAYYGPDDKTVTKIAAGVVMSDEDDDDDVIIERWVKTDILADQKILDEVKRYLASHGVKSVVVTDGVLGCPHEEGIDFPKGQDCPFCPFWVGKQGTARRDDAEAADEGDDDEEVYDDEDDDEEPSGFQIEELTEEESAEMDAADALHAEAAEKSFERINAVLGDREFEDQGEAVEALFEYLKANLQLPCEVSGSEDFRWEEPYIIGGWDEKEYETLKKTQPSFEDKFTLLSINNDEVSPWMMFYGEDIAAVVKRVSDGKKFVLGLADLMATDPTSKNYQLIDDYAVWFVNSR